MPTCRHVVWDWNGTLLDDAALCVSIMNKMLARRGLTPISLPFYQAIIEFPVEGYYRKLGFDFSAEPFEAVSDEFVALYQAGWRDCPLQGGALGTIRSLNGCGVSQSVLSASLSSHLAEQLDHFGLTNLLHSVSGAEDHHGRGKLHIARDHAAATGEEPSAILFVGDTAHDAEVAREAGCDCLLVSFGHYGLERLEPLGLPVAESMGGVLRHILTSEPTGTR